MPYYNLNETVHKAYHNNNIIATACPAGTYLSPSNNSCSTCPANSVSEIPGLTRCTCVDGYYRALQGDLEEDFPCNCNFNTYNTYNTDE